MNISKELYEAVQKGKINKIESLFEITYEEYHKLVFVVISKYVGQKEDIEELTNDIFVNFFNHLHNIDPNKDIKYYLLTSAKNASINFIKANKKLSTSEYNDDLLMDVPSSNYQQLIELWKKIITVEECDLLIQHILEGYSLKEIAESKNQLYNTIKSNYRRTIKKIQKYERSKSI